MEEIAAEVVLNWDQTGMKLVPSSVWTMERQGERRVEMVGVNDKRQITAIFCGTMLGEFLPLQLIYKGKTNRCHPKFSFPLDWHITHSPNHWSNESTMLDYIKHIIVPYLWKTRENVGEDKTALVIIAISRAKSLSPSSSSLKTTMSTYVPFRQTQPIYYSRWTSRSTSRPRIISGLALMSGIRKKL